MLHGNDRSDKGSGEDDQNHGLDDGLEKERCIVSTNESRKGSQSTADRDTVMQCNTGGDFDAGEAIHPIDLAIVKQ